MPKKNLIARAGRQFKNLFAASIWAEALKTRDAGGNSGRGTPVSSVH